MTDPQTGPPDGSDHLAPKPASPPASGGAGYGGPQSSMALLVELLRDSGDPGYDDLARRRAADPAAGRRRGRVDVVIALLALAVVGLLLAAAAMQARRAAPVAAAARAELVARVAAANQRIDVLRAANGSLSEQVSALERQALESSDVGRELARRVGELAVAAQYTPVTGPGTRVTLQDSPKARGDEAASPDLGRILDRDIQLAVNGLWQAGAEAVAVNGVRLSARTAIRSAGGAILVDYRPLVPPYRIDAIGPPAMTDSFATGPAGRALSSVRDTYGIRFDLAAESALALPAATSALPVLAVPIGGSP